MLNGVTIPDEFYDVCDECDADDLLPYAIESDFISILSAISDTSVRGFGVRDYSKTATVTPNGENVRVEKTDDNINPVVYPNDHPAMRPGASTSFQLIHSDSGRVYRVTIEHISN